MPTMRRLRSDKASPVLELNGAGSGPPRSSFSPESSPGPFRKAASWLATVLIESFEASAVAMSHAWPISTPVPAEEDVHRRLGWQSEAGREPAWSHHLPGTSVSRDEISGGPPGRSVSRKSGVVRLWLAICKEWRARRAIVELQALDDRTLKDIGIYRCEIERVARHDPLALFGDHFSRHYR